MSIDLHHFVIGNKETIYLDNQASAIQKNPSKTDNFISVV
jgi:hypothetical protein